MLYIPMGQKKDFNRQAGRTAYPYRVSRYGGYDIDTHMTLDALRAGLLRGTIILKWGGNIMRKKYDFMVEIGKACKRIRGAALLTQ